MVELTSEQRAALEEQKQYCPFCKIIKGEIPANKVYEDNTVIAILDINPGSTGHTLVIPKEHYPVLPFMPKEELEKIALTLPELSSALRRAMINMSCEFFIANGAAAGQQTSHFLIHLFPTDKERFKVPLAPTEKGAQLKAALASKYASPKERLSQLLSTSKELREMIVETPNEFIKQLSSAPDLQKIFAGVDVEALSAKLSESETPRAVRMEPRALVKFLASKEKLREMLLNNKETLEMAMETQPKIKRFFEGSTIEAVEARYQEALKNV